MISGTKKSIALATIAISSLFFGATTFAAPKNVQHVNDEYQQVLFFAENIEADDDSDNSQFFESLEKIEVLIALKEDFSLNKNQISLLEKLSDRIDKIDETYYLFSEKESNSLDTALAQEIFIQQRLLRLSKEAKKFLKEFKESLNQETRNKIEQLDITI